MAVVETQIKHKDVNNTYGTYVPVMQCKIKSLLATNKLYLLTFIGTFIGNQFLLLVFDQFSYTDILSIFRPTYMSRWDIQYFQIKETFRLIGGLTYTRGYTVQVNILVLSTCPR